MTEQMWACTKCGVAFPEWDAEMKKEFTKCPYCEGELKLHEVVYPL